MHTTNRRDFTGRQAERQATVPTKLEAVPDIPRHIRWEMYEAARDALGHTMPLEKRRSAQRRIWKELGL